ncbi:hypothetical protein JMM61_11340 [Rhodovulum sulfidophilum]|uniref:hypothetical protein n=1 Tax=Rhodovulum sulfidophilum TaxID=35806 RepID=UPI001928798F|nr:hypothetical protein [Rhodovulum sulfidophilum]MBL3585971.1 hypothetical protein [Rhodovulum sulfidophilum]
MAASRVRQARSRRLRNFCPNVDLTSYIIEGGLIPKVNSVVRISCACGLIGLVFGSTGGKLDTILQGQNRMGWNMAEVIPDTPTWRSWCRGLSLVATPGLWTISSGYLFITEIMENPR